MRLDHDIATIMVRTVAGTACGSATRWNRGLTVTSLVLRSTPGGSHLPPNPLPLPRCERGRGRLCPAPAPSPGPFPFPPRKRKSRGVSVAVAILRPHLATIPSPLTSSPLSRSTGEGPGVRAARSAGEGPGVRAARTFPRPLSVPTKRAEAGR